MIADRSRHLRAARSGTRASPTPSSMRSTATCCARCAATGERSAPAAAWWCSCRTARRRPVHRATGRGCARPSAVAAEDDATGPWSPSTSATATTSTRPTRELARRLARNARHVVYGEAIPLRSVRRTGRAQRRRGSGGVRRRQRRPRRLGGATARSASSCAARPRTAAATPRPRSASTASPCRPPARMPPRACATAGPTAPSAPCSTVPACRPVRSNCPFPR